MGKGFRQSMNIVHTYSGLLLGWLLFAIFVTGTISYYHKEITLWMKPEFHKSQVSDKTLDIAVSQAIKKLKQSNNVSVILPHSRSNVIAIQAIKAKNNKANVQKSSQNKSNQKRKRRIPYEYYDASTGELIEQTTKTAGGSFLFRFHYKLYNLPRNVSTWLIGIATMFMLVAIVSGIIIHKKIFKDIFTFRAKANPRGLMDAHILPAVAVLPFFIMITYSGLLLFSNSMMPWAIKAYYGDDTRAYRQELRLNLQNKQEEKAKKQAVVKTDNSQVNNTKEAQRILNTNMQRAVNKYDTNTAQRLLKANNQREINSLENKLMNKKVKKEKLTISGIQLQRALRKANEVWPNNVEVFKVVKNPRKGTIYLEVNPREKNTIYSFKRFKEILLIDIKTNKILKHTTPPASESIISNTKMALFSLHMALFADSTLRFVFFLCGIAGVILAGTGLILWVKKRENKNQKKKSLGFFIVEKLNVGTIIGMFLAIAVYFTVNRFISLETERMALEIKAFFIAWAFSYIYAFLRNTSKAWIELFIITAVMFALLPFINLFTTLDGISSLFNRDMIFIYFDIFCLFIAAVFAFISFILIKKSKSKEVK